MTTETGQDELRRAHYLIEKRLADRLRGAEKAERQSLYGTVYDELYSELRRLGLLASVAQNDSQQVKLLLALLRPFLFEARNFIEFGAGDAALCRAVARQCPHLERVTAVEASTRPAGMQASGQDGIERLLPEQVLTEIGPATYDLAFSCHFVEHLHAEDLPDHLVRVKGMLKPGGCYVIITPNRLLGPHDVSRAFDKVATGLHLREYDHRTLAAELSRAGFSTVKALRGVASPTRIVSVRAVALAEQLSQILPRWLRFRVLEKLGKPEPLRALEQVKLVGIN